MAAIYVTGNDEARLRPENVKADLGPNDLDSGNMPGIRDGSPLTLPARPWRR